MTRAMLKCQGKLRTLWARTRYFGAVLRCRFSASLIPSICVVVVNHHCNFRCRYCFGNYYQRNSREYTTAELIRLFDELGAMGTRYLNLHGGEALLRKDLGQLVDHVKSKGMYCCVGTNGSLPDRIKEIRNADNITISLDGRRENNDRNRGPGAYDLALRGIHLVKELKIPLRVSATITRHTCHDIGYLAELAKEIGFDLLFSITFKPLPQAKDLQLAHQEIQEAMNEIIRYRKLGFPIFTSRRAAAYARDWPLDHNEHHYLPKDVAERLVPAFKPIRCYYGRNKFTFESDGKVYPCFLQTDDFSALDWREVGVRQALEHVRKTNTCIACPALSQNDHSLVYSLDPRHLIHVAYRQAIEILRWG